MAWRAIPRWRKAIAILLGVVWVGFSIALISFMFGESGLRENGTPATAEVLRFRDRGRNPDYADIRFVTLEGRTIETEVDVDDVGDPLEAGDSLEVRYDPLDPSGNVVVAHVDKVVYWLNRLLWVPILIFATSIPVMRVASLEVFTRRGKRKEGT